jgi:hypothetical protein
MYNASSRGWVFSSVVTALVFVGVCVRGQLYFSLKVSQKSSLGTYHLTAVLSYWICRRAGGIV